MLFFFVLLSASRTRFCKSYRYSHLRRDRKRESRRRLPFLLYVAKLCFCFLTAYCNPAKPCFKIERPWKHSFWPFLISNGAGESYFRRFQNRLGLATLILVVFKIIWGCNDSFRPFQKSIGRSDMCFGRFKNQLALLRLIFCSFLKSLLYQIDCVRYLPSVLGLPKKRVLVGTEQYLLP